ncbi:tripartite tricarboxylate transporter TctB family protein [Azospirillum thermophilum]|uniref:Tripartite tricarboxylate transporter TctB family protein n=1 Tax=Azospirillum thermophilum TaxID=2202148 RepID=A0A2S2CT81_9PROT|nr:tripartite tricarboxylate transporter TctB family protein [Azospirillum thermophilum]AWK87688.1 tripartite tricarboxylate transporter TctB family protein [Azospirillum thermophilum]
MTHITRSPPVRVRSPRELAAAFLISAIALAGLWIGRDWETGTLAMVQAGFFPRLICVLLLATGLATLAGALAATDGTGSGWAWRPVAAITASVLSFAALLDRIGLVLAILALIVIGGLAGRPLRPVPLAMLWAVLATSCVALFSWGLGLPLPIWP